MKIIVALVVLLASTSFVAAYNPIIAEPSQAYEIIPIEGDPYVQREYLGNLNDFPDMYELTSDVAFTLQVKVRQRANGVAPFGLIIVRQNEDDGGVTEVVRLNQPLEEWTEVKDSTLGMKFLEGTVLSREVEPGTYRHAAHEPSCTRGRASRLEWLSWFIRRRLRHQPPPTSRECGRRGCGRWQPSRLRAPR